MENNRSHKNLFDFKRLFRRASNRKFAQDYGFSCSRKNLADFQNLNGKEPLQSWVNQAVEMGDVEGEARRIFETVKTLV